MMHVAINGWFLGQETTGSGQYLHQLLHHLPNEAPSSSWSLILPSPPTREVPAPWRVEVAPPPKWLPHKNLRKVWFEQVTFPLACRRVKANLAHVPYWASPLRSFCPVVVTIHDIIPRLLPAYRGGLFLSLYTWLVSKSAQRATLVLTDSYASLADITRVLGIPEKRVRVTHLAADAQIQRVNDTTQLTEIRARYQLPERFILYMGGFDVRKNVPAVLRAFATAIQNETISTDTFLVIAGRLPETNTAFAPDPREIAKALKIDTRVVFTGWVDEADKSALYSLSNVFVFPSQYEGFGLPVLEAMSCGAFSEHDIA